jgi:hypothetical protein
MAYLTNNVAFAAPATDAFGRGRVSQPTSLFAVSFEYDAQPLLMQILNAGTGTTTKTSNVSNLTLATGGTANNAGTILQSHAYFRYEPGKSQLIQMTGIIGAAKANVRSQIGYYDVNNGVFFDQNNGINVTLRTNTSGSPVDTAVAQASWNIDKMDGTGPSGQTLDFTKEQVFCIDMQWLGAGRVRFGFNIAGTLYYCHQILNANSVTLPYMNTASLPLRWEIHNTGTAASSTTMIAQCGSVISEGGEESPKKLQFSAQNARAGVSVTTFVPVISIQPQTTFSSITNRGRYAVVSIDIADSSTNGGSWELVYNPTLTGASFAAFNATDSAMNVDTSATAMSGGVVIASGFVAGGGHSEIAIDLSDLKMTLGLDIAGTTADIFTIACQSFSGIVSFNAAITWTEER